MSIDSKSIRLRKLTLTECGGIISFNLDCPSLLTFILSGCSSLDMASLRLDRVISVEIRGMIRLRNFSLAAFAIRNLRLGSPELVDLNLDWSSALDRLAFFGCRALRDEQLLKAGLGCPNVRTLTFMDCGLVTATGLKEFKKLTSLDVKGIIIKDTPDRYDSCPNLRVLNTGTSDHDDVSHMLWAQIVIRDMSVGGRIPKLKELVVLNSFGSAAILRVLTHCLHLSKVSVTSGKILPEIRLLGLSDEEDRPTRLVDFCASKGPMLRKVRCESNSVWRSLMELNLSEHHPKVLELVYCLSFFAFII